MKYLSHIVFGVFLVVIVLGTSLVMLPYVPYVGRVEIKIVQSGSMEPGIKTGGIVVIREAPEYRIGDVVTFTSRTADVPTTHRIVSEEVVDGTRTFVTKGDANEDRDADLMYEENILGRVLFTVPYVGFILDFARQPLGFGLLIGIPALLIIIDEIEKIWTTLRRRKHESEDGEAVKEAVTASSRDLFPPLVITPMKERPRVTMHDILPPRMKTMEKNATVALKEEFVFERYTQKSSRRAMSGMASFLVAISIAAVSPFVGNTISYFNDLEEALANLLGTPSIDFTLSVDKSSFVVLDGVLEEGGDHVLFTVLPTPESDPLLYRASTTVKGGDPAFCNLLNAASAVPFVYNDVFPGLVSPTSTSFDGFGGEWSVGVSVGDVSLLLPGTTCELTVTVTGWHEDRTEAESQYVDEESVTLTYTIGGVVEVPLVASAALFAPLDENFETGTETPEETIPDDVATGTPEETETPDDESSGGGGGTTDESTEEVPPVTEPEEVAPADEPTVEEPTIDETTETPEEETLPEEEVAPEETPEPEPEPEEVTVPEEEAAPVEEPSANEGGEQALI